MSDKLHINFEELRYLAKNVADLIVLQFASELLLRSHLRVYPVPRGGIPAAFAVAEFIPLRFVHTAETADLIIDDLVDTGITKKKFEDFCKPFFPLIDKRSNTLYRDKWIVWPWEYNDIGSFEDTVTRLLQFVGENPLRGGLKETPTRVVKAWQHWCGGYALKAEDILKTFEDGAEKYNQMITVKDIPLYSHCEHHLAPIFGTATVSYIPKDNIVGLSKLSRLVDMYARRLQVQERLTNQIADALYSNLKPVGVGVNIKARHLCMESRGVCQQGHYTITTALRGAMEEQNAKEEFLKLV